MSRASATVLALLLMVGTVAPVAADEPDPLAMTVVGAVVPGEVIVKYHDPKAGADAARADGLQVMAELGTDAEEMPLLVSTEGRSVDAVLADLNADPAVEYAEPNYVVGIADKPPAATDDGGAAEFGGGAVSALPPDTGATAVAVNDPRSSSQYSLDRMQVRSAWGLSPGGSAIVAVLDTGVQFDHPDLAGRLLEGYDFVSSDTDATDDNGHGTWVSGIVAANPNEGYGMAGISWNDRILPVKIMNSNGLGDTSDLTSGIIWAADSGATIINMSVGGFPYSQYVQDAVNYAWSKGAVLVGAAGNNRREESYYPASFNNVVSVSATQQDDEFSNWSSYGPRVDVSAPGASVLTTHCYTCAGKESWGSHTSISGTSFATPNVAGVVALIRGKFPTEGPAQIVNRLFASVDDMGYPGLDNRYGLGRVNAARAVGGGTATPRTATGDALESNNVLGSAPPIPLGRATGPTIHPAGDVDVFAVDLPASGRLDVTVQGVVDTARAAKNALPMDPVVELYTTAGALLVRVDNEWESGAELASHSVATPTRILVRVRNYYSNGTPVSYTITPSFHPSSRFSDTASSPYADEIEWLADEGITTGCHGDQFCPTDAVTREQMASFLSRAMGLAPVAGDHFTDDSASAHQDNINRVAAAGVTVGCGGTDFCPATVVLREQMASFLARALSLAPAATDYFGDDQNTGHQADINRLAAAGVSNGCALTLFCPNQTVTREQMAAFLYRAFAGS